MCGSFHVYDPADAGFGDVVGGILGGDGAVFDLGDEGSYPIDGPLFS